jgi:RNA polymerase sigma-70 factor (ECF subfamily)
VEAERNWQAGDPVAFEQLVRRWQQPVTRFLFHITGQAELALDLCQEVFLRLWLHRQRYRQTGAFSVWLYRIALNVARDALRRQRRQKRALPAPGAVPSVVAPAVDALCARAECSRLVIQALAQLPEPLRVVVVLRHYEGMSFEDIARLLKKPASTIKSRFSAALLRLRQLLQPWCDQLLEPDI